MIKSIIEYSAKNRFLVILSTLALCFFSWQSLKKIPIDAIPDLSDTQVIVYTKWDRSPDLIENQITYPVISKLLGAPKVKSVRGVSDYGYSYIYVIFEDGTDLYWARSRVLEYLNQIDKDLPADAQSSIGPDASSVGWVFQYAIRDKNKNLNLAELRAIQDWNLKFQLQSIEGVAEIASIGGFVKQYQIKVDPTKLELYEVSFQEVMDAVRDSNQESGARTIEFSGTEAMLRSQSLVEKLSDIENATVAFKQNSRAPILVKQVAKVSIGAEMRRGVSDLNGEGDTVGGIVVMRQSADPTSVIKRVKTRIAEIQKSLPEGVEIISVYDRSDLIDRAIETLKSTLFEELLVVSLIILLFLWHIPSAMVPIVSIPISVLIAFIPLYLLGFTSNIMSLAGIAISIGVLVDGAIVEVENAYRKIYLWESTGRKVKSFFEVRLEALTEVGPSVFFSLLLIAVSFLPIFTLVDQEGRLFKPLAYSKTFAMTVAAILAITLDPALRMLFARIDPFRTKYNLLNFFGNHLFVGKYYSEENHPISKILFRIYRPVIDWVLDYKKTCLGISLAAILSILIPLSQLGSEFMPTLHEGSILYMPTALPGLSVTEAQNIITKQDLILKSIPEVQSVFGKAGRADTSTDTAPLSMVETTIVLKPKDQWRTQDRFYKNLPKFLQKILSRIWPMQISEEQIISEMDQKLKFLGMPNIWTMPIKNRIDMLSTGIRSAVGVKVFGPDLITIQKIATDIEAKLSNFPGVRNVFAERVASGYYLDINFYRDRLAEFGLSVKNAQDQAMKAIGGSIVGQSLYSRERYPIQVRMAPAFRQDIEAISRLPILSPTGAQIPLQKIAEIKFNEGPAMIRDEDAQLASYVYIDIDPEKIDMGGFVTNAKKHIEKELVLPTGYSIRWSGQYENMLRVKENLYSILPITFFLILLILFFNTKSWVKTGIVLLAVPFSLIGAFWFLFALDYNMSIAVWVGIIALMGLDAETGVFMLMYLDLAFDEKCKLGKMNNLIDLKEAIIEGAVHRIRPKFMTVSTLFIGLLPILWSTGQGADVMKRIAAPMIGGVFSSFLLELVIYPVLYFIWKERTLFNLKKEIL